MPCPPKTVASQLLTECITSAEKGVAIAGQRAIDDESVHALRLLFKRLQALLLLASPDCESARTQSAKLRLAARRLALLRDTAVVAKTLDRGLRLCEGASSQQRKQFIDSLTAPERMKMRGRQKVAAPAAAELSLKRFISWSKTLSQTPRSGSIELSSGLDRTYRKARKRIREAVLNLEADPDQFHRCRRWIKRAVFQAEYLAAGSNAKAAKFRRRADKLQDMLGQHHDWTVALALLSGRGPRIAGYRHFSSAPDKLVKRRAEVEQRIRDLSKIFDLKPRKFLRRILS